MFFVFLSLWSLAHINAYTMDDSLEKKTKAKHISILIKAILHDNRAAQCLSFSFDTDFRI